RPHFADARDGSLGVVVPSLASLLHGLLEVLVAVVVHAPLLGFQLATGIAHLTTDLRRSVADPADIERAERLHEPVVAREYHARGDAEPAFGAGRHRSFHVLVRPDDAGKGL